MVRAGQLNDLVRLGAMPRHAAAFLEAAVASGLNVLVAGLVAEVFELPQGEDAGVVRVDGVVGREGYRGVRQGARTEVKTA